MSRPGRAQREFEIAPDRPARIQREVLEHQRDVARRRVARRHVLPAHDDRSRVGALEAGDGSQQRRLARAGRTQHHQQLVGVRLELNVAQRLGATEPLRETAHAEEGRGRGGAHHLRHRRRRRAPTAGGGPTGGDHQVAAVTCPERPAITDASPWSRRRPRSARDPGAGAPRRRARAGAAPRRASPGDRSRSAGGRDWRCPDIPRPPRVPAIGPSASSWTCSQRMPRVAGPAGAGAAVHGDPHAIAPRTPVAPRCRRPRPRPGSCPGCRRTRATKRSAGRS